jgi:hypothetical protein
MRMFPKRIIVATATVAGAGGAILFSGDYQEQPVSRYYGIFDSEIDPYQAISNSIFGCSGWDAWPDSSDERSNIPDHPVRLELVADRGSDHGPRECRSDRAPAGVGEEREGGAGRHHPRRRGWIVGPEPDADRGIVEEIGRGTCFFRRASQSSETAKKTLLPM